MKSLFSLANIKSRAIIKMNAGFTRILLDLLSFEALGGLALPGWRGSKIFLGQCFSVGMYPHVYVRLW